MAPRSSRNSSKSAIPERVSFLLSAPVSCPISTLLDPPVNFRAGQGAPTRDGQLKGTGEEAQRRTARKGAAQ